MTPFERATAERDRLDRAAKAAGLALATFPTEGPLGLTPDHVKASTAWRTAHASFRAAFDALRAFNATYCSRFKSELRAERRARAATR